MIYIHIFHLSVPLSTGDVKEKSTEISMEDCQWMFPNLDTIKFILQNISDNIEFIISDKIDILTENLPTSKRSLVCFDNILKVKPFNS